MASIKGGDKLDAYLRDLAKRLGKGEVLSVGFFEDRTYPDGTSVPLVAAVQNFGAPSRGIPPRPFFSDMVAEKAESWGPQLEARLKATDYDATKALGQMGLLIEGQLREAIQATDSPPLAEATIARKGFDKPLIDTGVMINGVTSKVSAQ